MFNMRSALLLSVFAFILLAAFTVSNSWSAEDTAKRISIDKLKGMIGNDDLIVVDVRLGASKTSDKTSIAGSVREDPSHVAGWMKKYPKDKTIVFYCS